MLQSQSSREFSKPIMIGVLCLSLAACAEGREGETIGTVAGGALGAVLGSQFGGGKGQLAAVAIGAIAGAWAGSELGKKMDEEDKVYAQRTAQDAMEYNKAGQTSTWRNPDSGNSGTVTPVQTYENTAGKDCREFETSIFVDGEQEKGTGTACRQSDGTWQIES